MDRQEERRTGRKRYWDKHKGRLTGVTGEYVERNGRKKCGQTGRGTGTSTKADLQEWQVNMLNMDRMERQEESDQAQACTKVHKMLDRLRRW